METKANDLSRPHSIPKRLEDGVVVEYDQHLGLTKREHMAIEFTKALAISADRTVRLDNMAKFGIDLADELIKQLNKTTK
jgi:hypothetical protein